MINDIQLICSLPQKQEIRNLEQLVNEKAKENRVKWANLIKKQSELSSRKHRLSLQKLEFEENKNRESSKLEIINKYQKEIKNYQIQLKSLLLDIEENENEYSKIINRMNLIKDKNLKLLSNDLQSSIQERKRNISILNKSIITLKKKMRYLKSQKKMISMDIEKKKALIDDYCSREQKVKSVLNQPIDDLRLEEMTVNKMEQFILKYDNVNLEDENEEEKYNEELKYVGSLEKENLQTQKRIENIRNNIINLKETIDSKKTINHVENVQKEISEKMEKNSSKEIKNDLEDETNQRILEYNNIIKSLKDRFNEIDNLEKETTLLQIQWSNTQAQIEDSWTSKMEILQNLQKKSDEVENLMFDIDEVSDQIHQLKEQEMLLFDEKNEILKNNEKLKERLNNIEQDYQLLQNKVEDYSQRKNEFESATERIQNRKQNISILKKHIESIVEEYKIYQMKVEDMESSLSKLNPNFKLNFNTEPMAKTEKVVKERNHIKFTQDLSKLNWKPKTPFPARYKNILSENIDTTNNYLQNSVDEKTQNPLTNSAHNSKINDQISTPVSKSQLSKRFESYEISNGDTFSDNLDSQSNELVKNDTSLSNEQYDYESNQNSEVEASFSFKENEIAKDEKQYVSKIIMSNNNSEESSSYNNENEEEISETEEYNTKISFDTNDFIEFTQTKMSERPSPNTKMENTQISDQSNNEENVDYSIQKSDEASSFNFSSSSSVSIKLDEKENGVNPKPISKDYETPNPNRYNFRLQSSPNTKSDDDFNSLISEVQAAIKMPLLQSQFTEV